MCTVKTFDILLALENIPDLSITYYFGRLLKPFSPS